MTALPLGGIGTGNVALAATGALRQWQLHNRGNHLGFLPLSFFALRLASVEPPLSIRRVLQTNPVEVVAGSPAPLVNDHLDSPGEWTGPRAWPRVQDTVFTGQYPFARLEYVDDWPVEVSMEACTPFVPLDVEASSMPLATFTFTITNRFRHDLHGWTLATLQNVVGWDGVTPIRDARCAILGGNRNHVEELGATSVVTMTNETLDPEDPGSGTMALWSSASTVAMPQFDDADTALAALDSLKLLGPVVFENWTPAALARAAAAVPVQLRWPHGASPPGSTWAAGLAAPIHLAPGESVDVEFVYAWHFPNRYADFDRFGDSDRVDTAPTYVGNAYTERFTDARDVIEQFAKQRDSLLEASRTWRDAIYGSSLPADLVETLAAQPSLIRSPTVFRSADGATFGFEGVLGESTLNWNGNVGGSCPLNCTHVWNYEQAMARLFPTLERSMRELEWNVLQAPEGYLPHRLLLPLDGAQLHSRPVGGPTGPALDGMLGAVLKTLREVQRGAGLAWLARYLPHARRLIDYVERTWDPDASGLLTGDQPVTHDISLQGPNMFVGSLWLAALRAMEEMALLVSSSDEARSFRARFDRARVAYDEALWNGEYYAQQSLGSDFDFGAGCLSDQLFGQWWAHQLDLGHLLPVDHVRRALAAIVRHNLRAGFRDFEHGYRVFADEDDSGLLNCTWPHGGRPAVPIRYADEVWTGVEYQVAAHCFYEGMVEDGVAILAAVRGRYDGRRRNPYNEIECGDHYARAMAGWSALEAFTGSRYDAVDKQLRVGTRAARYPVVAVDGWGEMLVVAPDSAVLRCLSGRIEIARFTIGSVTTELSPHITVRSGEEMTLSAP